MYYVYMLFSKAFSQIYIGSTVDLKSRFHQHNDGKVVSTRRYMPWRVWYYEAYNSEKLARLREKRLKYNGNAIKELKNRVGLEGLYPAPVPQRYIVDGKVGWSNQKKDKMSSFKGTGAGFTIIELMVVVSIMIILTSAMILNLNSQRASRDVAIAQNRLVSSLRQAQSYTLSSRLVPTGQSAQYYLIKFDLSQPGQYTLQAIYNANSSPQYLQDIETIALPNNIRLAAVNPLVISRSSLPNVQAPAACGLAAFAAPFAKIYLNDGCSQTGPPGNPYPLADSDGYQNILRFVANTDCLSPGNPAVCNASADSLMVVTLTNASNTVVRKVLINGITGAVCPSLDGTSCQTSY